MGIRLTRPYSPADDNSVSPPSKTWLNRFQQIQSLMYLVAGAFLIYQYWKSFHRQVVLVAGVLFILYGVYRFFLVRRSSRGQ